MRAQIIPTSRRRVQHGQSTVEFMLMVPVLFAILFFVVEMGLYFSTVHYGTYAAFATARAQQVGFSPYYGSVEEVSRLILTGAVWEPGAATAIPGSADPTDAFGVGVALAGFEDKIPFPFINALLPDTQFDTRVNLGPDERQYEGVEGRAPDQYDNNL